MLRKGVEGLPVRTKMLDQLGKALSKIDRPGTFCVSGSVPAILPGLEVLDLGPIALPITARQARELKKHCSQAAYGKGEQTIVDTSVRKVWRLEPDRFALTNPDWDRLIKETVGKVQQELGLEKQKLEGHLYELLLYEPGCFFLPHRDGEKLDRMVATLVVMLPSTFEGGELVVRHDGQERTINFQGDGDSQFRIQFAAFYADCEHEIRPLRKGYRLALVYNLTLSKKTRKAINAPRESEQIEQIRQCLRESLADESLEKLVITLDHQYTKDGLAWDTLKGADRAKAKALVEAARQEGFKAYLGLLTFWESGSAEYAGGGYGYSGYGRRRRSYDYYDEDDASQYEMGEIYETSLTAENLTDGQGQGLPIGTLTIEKEDLLDPEALTQVTPEEDFEGYTGNAGMTIDRWYRHATIILWPERRHFEILCDRDSRAVVPVLIQMVKQLKGASARDAAVLKPQCLALANAILDRWSENRYSSWRVEQKPERSELLKTLAELDQPDLIRGFLRVMVQDIAVEPDKSIAKLCQDHGWQTFQQELLAVMEATTAETMERNVRLLEHLSTAKPRQKEEWSHLTSELSQALVSAIETIDQNPAAEHWRSRNVNRAEVLAGLNRSLIATEQFDHLSRVVNHALAAPKWYPLTTVHLPALESLQPGLQKNLKQPAEALSHWLASCREQLEALTARKPEEPNDFRRGTLSPCKCQDCAELNRFLEDPKEAVHRFRLRQDRRDHLSTQICSHKADLDLRTEKTSSPHILVCTKNKASYFADLATYQRNLEHLKTVNAIAAALPKTSKTSKTSKSPKSPKSK
ncbi:hypothetical protein BH23PLA1_BH23PLA1_13690 [soil metagenome]